MTKTSAEIARKMKIAENEFSPAPGGAGSINGQPGYGTFSSPDVSQNSSQFASGGNNKSINQFSNTRGNNPASGSVEQDVSAIFSKKQTPSPDEVVAGIKYELGQQIKKDKFKAKEEVLKNLKKDPKFYSGLKMLNIDDKSMVDNMTENKKHPNDAPQREKISSNIEETKKIFEDLSKEKDNKYVVNSGIVDVMKQMWEQKRQRNAWKNNGSN